MRPKYKMVKVPAPFCPTCDEQLKGNNSFANPYKCACGIWESNGFTDPLNFEIIPHKLETRNLKNMKKTLGKIRIQTNS